MKKILFVANVGKEHILKFHLPTIKQFKEEGWNVDVICSGNDFIPICDHWFKAKWSRNPFSFSIFRGLRQIKKIIDANKYDVVYCHTPVGGFVGRLAAKKRRKTGTKVVYFSHGYHFYKKAPILNWLLYYPVEKHLSKYTDAFFVINDEDALITQKRFKKPLFLLNGIGVDFSKFQIIDKAKKREEYRQEFGIKDTDYVMIYVAELIKNKNQSLLIKSLKLLTEKDSSFKLVLVGPDHYKGKYQKLASKMRLSNNVIFTGWRKDVPELLNMSDLCVASSTREGFGLNLIEAAYVGLPIVATDNRGHRCVAKSIPVLLAKNNCNDFSSSILKISSSREQSIPNKNVLIEKFDSKEIAKRIVRIIDSL